MQADSPPRHSAGGHSTDTVHGQADTLRRHRRTQGPAAGTRVCPQGLGLLMSDHDSVALRVGVPIPRPPPWDGRDIPAPSRISRRLFEVCSVGRGDRIAPARRGEPRPPAPSPSGSGRGVRAGEPAVGATRGCLSAREGLGLF